MEEEIVKRKPDPEAMPSLPPTIQMAKNFLKAAGKHVMDGMRKVTFEEYQARIDKCNKCVPPEGWRMQNRCTHPSCGCFLDIKAWWRSEDCPVEKWPKLQDENQEES